MDARDAAIYTRISRDRLGEGLGVDRQEQDCRALAESLGWNVADVYTDNDISAFSGKRRPEYQRLIADIDAGTITGVIAWHPDRLHRSPKELEGFIDLLERRHVGVHTVQSGHYDLSTASGRAVARTVGAWARYESEHKSERIRRKHREIAEAGGWHGGKRPYGYEADGRTVRESEAAIIRRCADQLIAGITLHWIARDLNAREVPTATGESRWLSPTLRDILMSPRIAGLRRHHGKVTASASWPAIIPEDQWETVTRILADTSRVNNPGRPVQWLGSGIYICSGCERRTLRVATGGRTNRQVYRCTRVHPTLEGRQHVSRGREDVDEVVENVIVGRLERAGIANLLADDEDAQDVAELRAEAVGVRQRLDQLADMFAEGSITATQLSTGTTRMRDRLEQLDRMIGDMSNRSPLSLVAGAPDIRKLWFGTAPDGSDALAVGVRRAVLEALAIVTILPGRPGRAGFDPETVHIEWKA